jgi:hypothetical protein
MRALPLEILKYCKMAGLSCISYEVNNLLLRYLKGRFPAWMQRLLGRGYTLS